MIASSKEDPEQEYLCKYKIGKDSIFGTVGVEDQQGKMEWVVEAKNDDDNIEQVDNYDEKEDKDRIHWHEF